MFVLRQRESFKKTFHSLVCPWSRNSVVLRNRKPCIRLMRKNRYRGRFHSTQKALPRARFNLRSISSRSRYIFAVKNRVYLSHTKISSFGSHRVLDPFASHFALNSISARSRYRGISQEMSFDISFLALISRDAKRKSTRLGSSRVHSDL